MRRTSSNLPKAGAINPAPTRALLLTALISFPSIFLGCDDYGSFNPVRGGGEAWDGPYAESYEDAFYYDYAAASESSSETHTLYFCFDDATCSLVVEGYTAGTVWVSMFSGCELLWTHQVSSDVSESVRICGATPTYCTVTYMNFTGYVSFSCTGNSWALLDRRGEHGSQSSVGLPVGKDKP